MQGVLREFRPSIGWNASLHVCHSLRRAIHTDAGLEGPKKNWGGKKTRVRAKKGLRGQIKHPSPDKKAPGVPVTLWLRKESEKSSRP